MLAYLLIPAEFKSFLDLLHHSWAEMTRKMDPEGAAILERGGNGLQQALLVFGVWATIFLLYGAALLSNFIVLSNRYSLRPSLRLTPFTPRGYVLVAMAVAALFGLIGNPSETGSLPDVARIICLLLLLPYFVSGLGSIHQALSRWQHPAIWQVGFYILLFFTLWPALPIALYGIVRQVTRLTTNHPR